MEGWGGVLRTNKRLRRLQPGAWPFPWKFAPLCLFLPFILAWHLLSLHPQKTRLIEFGKYASGNRKRKGKGKPETFDFLGFTHMCSKNRRGDFFLRRKTKKKQLKKKLREVKDELRERMHERIKVTGEWLATVVDKIDQM